MANSNIQITILIPCLNEAETIGSVINKILSANPKRDYEILIADNGSTDGTLDILSKLPVKVISVAERGYGAALNAGIAEANSEFVVMGDADDSYALEDFQDFKTALEDGADVVMGNRFAGGIERGAMPLLHRYLGNPLLSFIGRVFFKNTLRDFHCGIRGFRRSRILELSLKSTGMEFATEMIAKASRRGLKIVEIATILRVDGRSRAPHLRTWRDGWRHLKFMLAYSPMWAFFIPGFSSILIGSIILIIDSFSDLILFGRSTEVMAVLLSSSLIIAGTLSIITSDIVQKLAFYSSGADDSKILSTLSQLLRSKSIFIFGVMTQSCGSLWIIYLMQSWISGNLDGADQLTRIKYGLVFLLITSVNTTILVHRIVSYFIEKEFLRK